MGTEFVRYLLRCDSIHYTRSDVCIPCRRARMTTYSEEFDCQLLEFFLSLVRLWNHFIEQGNLQGKASGGPLRETQGCSCVGQTRPMALQIIGVPASTHAGHLKAFAIAIL